MTLTAADRETLNAAKRIQRSLNRERRRNVLAQRPEAKKDRGRQRDTAHLAYVRRLPCVATYLETGRFVYGCQAAHVRMVREGKPGAMGVKPSDKYALPMTPEQHDRQTNRGGERGFWAALNFDPIPLCEALHAVSGDIEAGERIIRQARGSDR
jgi:hypothetical protein